MIRVTILFPNDEGSKFDHEYYMNNHVPMAKGLLEPLGLVAFNVDKGISDTDPNAPPRFHVIAGMVFNTVEGRAQRIHLGGTRDYWGHQELHRRQARFPKSARSYSRPESRNVMAEVCPFRGLRYNSDIVGNLSDIIAPPFDTISPELQESLYSRSPHNVVRLEAGKRLPTDTSSDNRYTRTASLLMEWLSGDVLQMEDSPCFYLVRHAFTIGGQPTSRLELMTAVGLAEYDEWVVLPHENTRDADKEDRLALISAARANISPIMCLYRDPSGEVPAVLADAAAKEPLAGVHRRRGSGLCHVAIGRPRRRGENSGSPVRQPPLHSRRPHRYETALNYRRAMSEESAASRPAPWDFVMMGLVDFDDPGLRVLPYHRTLASLDQGGLEKIREKLRAVFRVGTVGWRHGLAGSGRESR